VVFKLLKDKSTVCGRTNIDIDKIGDSPLDDVDFIKYDPMQFWGAE